MNRRMIIAVVGRIVRIEAVLLLLPAIVAAIYRESSFSAFIITAAAAALGGTAMILLAHPSNDDIFAKEGFVITALSWIALSAVGALPFVISGEIPNYIDAFFETVSGFTTTGSSILTDVEALSHGILFWRSFTHWIGGMGILVLMAAILPSTTGRTMHILKAEMPGPIIGKLVPRVRDTAKLLYILYLALTAFEVVFLLFGGMSLFESLVHAFGTAGTGGFTIKSDGLAGYNHYLQWVIIVFMLLFGVNFNLYYLLLIRRFKAALKSGELWCYIGIALASTAVITLNILPMCQGFGDALRLSGFQVASIVTTTGYSTANFDMWPQLSKTVLFLLMFMGGCAGSTAGGFKVSRVMLLIKSIRREFKKMLHPRSVGAVRFEGKKLDDRTLHSVNNYLAIYAACLVVVVLLLGFEPLGFETNVTAAVTCFNNVGPGFAAIGPMENFSCYSEFSKVLLSVAMLMGRLEIYPILFLFSPSVWSRR